MEVKPLHRPKQCTICGKTFTPKIGGQNTCSFSCRLIKKRNAARDYHRERRRKEPIGECYICGFDKAIDQHHEGGKEYKLCPNCHARISRGYSTMEELLVERDGEKV